ENKKEVALNESNKEQEVLAQQKMKNLNLSKLVKKNKSALSNKNFFCFILKFRQMRLSMISISLKEKKKFSAFYYFGFVLFFLFPVTYKKAFGIYSDKLEFFFSLVAENTKVVKFDKQKRPLFLIVMNVAKKIRQQLLSIQCPQKKKSV
ncbi:hypothetical protein RFI_36103, partial [Reticulomyxa filosa]